MNRIIVSDSCAEITQEMQNKSKIEIAPFFIDVLDVSMIADESVDIDNLVELMAKSKEAVRTAAPTPDSFYSPAKGYDEVFYVTISSKLSTTYNNARIAKTMLEDEKPNVKVHVFDSKSAACGETKVITWIQEEMEQNKSFEEIVENVENKIKNLNTIFVLENLDNLIKNGRMSKLSGFIASALSIHPVCIGNEGKIEVKEKSRGIKSALNRMVNLIGEMTDTFSDKDIFITYIRNKERANNIKNLIEEKYDFKEINVISGTALSSTYANDGGIIISF